MLIRRCAWHVRYTGHARVLGVRCERRWRVRFTDGICSDCTARWRAESGLPARKEIG